MRGVVSRMMGVATRLRGVASSTSGRLLLLMAHLLTPCKTRVHAWGDVRVLTAY